MGGGITGVGGGVQGCKRTPKSFVLVKIWAKSVEFWAMSLKTFTKSLKHLSKLPEYTSKCGAQLALN